MTATESLALGAFALAMLVLSGTTAPKVITVNRHYRISECPAPFTPPTLPEGFTA